MNKIKLILFFIITFSGISSVFADIQVGDFETAFSGEFHTPTYYDFYNGEYKLLGFSDRGLIAFDINGEYILHRGINTSASNTPADGKLKVFKFSNGNTYNSIYKNDSGTSVTIPAFYNRDPFLLSYMFNTGGNSSGNCSGNCQITPGYGLIDNSLYVAFRFNEVGTTNYDYSDVTKIGNSVTGNSNSALVNDSNLVASDLMYSDVNSDSIIYQIDDSQFLYMNTDRTNIRSFSCSNDFNGVCEDTLVVAGNSGETFNNFFASSDSITDTIVSVSYSDSGSTLQEYFYFFATNPTPVTGVYAFDIDWTTGFINTIPEYGTLLLDFPHNSSAVPMLFPIDNTGNIDWYYTYNDTQYVSSTSDPFSDFIFDGYDNSYTGGSSGSGLLSNGTGSTVDGNDSSQWSYTTSGYTFFENGFTLNNFVPSPYGGVLSFDIIQPGNIDPIRTDEFGSYEVDGLGYGFDSQVKITFPYHPEAGDYQVRVVYKYNGLEVFPFGSDYNTYNITVAEVRNTDPIEWDYQACNDGNEDDSFLAGVSNFFLCTSQFSGDVVSGAREISLGIIGPIKRIIDSLAGLGDAISFNIIPGAYADNTEALEAWGDALSNANVDEESNLYKPIDFMRGFIFIILGLVVLALFIFFIRD